MHSTNKILPISSSSQESTSRKRRPIDLLSSGLFVVALAGALVIALHWLRPVDILLWLVFSGLTALPGWSLGLLRKRSAGPRQPGFWAGGAVFGWAISSYILLLVGYLSGGVQLWPVWLIAAASVVGCLIGWRRQHRSSGAESPAWERGEYRVLAVALAIVLVFIARPFLSVGALTPDGYAYPWLFGFDFTNRVSIAANAAVGLPPAFFHIHGETFHYYLLTYILPVAFKQLTGGSAEMFSVLILWCVNLTVTFTVLLIAVLRLFVKQVKALLFTTLTVFAAYSFYWVYVAGKAYARAHPGEWPATVGDGAWMTYSNVSHLVYRYFLVEPQTVLSMAILLPVLGYLVLQRGRLRHLTAGFGIGLALGLVFGADALLTAWAGLGLGIAALLDLAQSRNEFGRSFAAWVAAGAVFVVMAAGYYLIGMYAAEGSRSVVLGLHGRIAEIFPVFIFIEFGPLLVWGVIGAVYLLRKNTLGGVTWWLLAAAAVFAVLFVQAQYDDQLGLLKGSRFLFVLFAMATGVFWQQFLSRPRTRKANLLLAGLLLLALPTWATDWLKTSDTTDRDETVYIQPADYRACRWIKSSLPVDAIIQSSPSYTNFLLSSKTDPYMSPLMANFAERPMAIGCWGMPQMIPDIEGKFYRILADVKSMFSSDALDSVMACVERYDIEYIYYGPMEKKRWPLFESVLNAYPEHLVKEYDRDDVQIYRIGR